MSGFFSQALNVRQIYELGRFAYDSSDWTHATDWIRTALNMIGDKKEEMSIDRSTLLDYLAFSEYKVLYFRFFISRSLKDLKGRTVL